MLPLPNKICVAGNVEQPVPPLSTDINPSILLAIKLEILIASPINLPEGNLLA